ncbi:MAG: TetR/AcrR family transcriptional regulator [Rhodoferax sp.]|nr:TetR/AcrR family transcriptional regulator [Rhodoferax sp.]
MDIQILPAKQATEVRQAGLIAAALKLAAQCSPADITTTDLAREVGITQGAVFKHFASKEAIWLAAMDWVTVTLMTQLEAAAATAKSDAQAQTSSSFRDAWPLAALRAVFLAHVDFVVCNPGVPRLVFQELQRPDDSELKSRVRLQMTRYRTLLMHLLVQAKKLELIAPDADMESASVLFIGSIQGLVMQSLITANVSAMAKQAPKVFGIFARGVFVNHPSF